MDRDNMDSEGRIHEWHIYAWIRPFSELLTAVERFSCLHPLAIVPRKRLDISFWDITTAVRLSLKAMIPRKVSGSVLDEVRPDVSHCWRPLPCRGR